MRPISANPFFLFSQAHLAQWLSVRSPWNACKIRKQKGTNLVGNNENKWKCIAKCLIERNAAKCGSSCGLKENLLWQWSSCSCQLFTQNLDLCFLESMLMVCCAWQYSTTLLKILFVTVSGTRAWGRSLLTLTHLHSQRQMQLCAQHASCRHSSTYAKTKKCTLENTLHTNTHLSHKLCAQTL